jgi:hypothetical protein
MTTIVLAPCNLSSVGCNKLLLTYEKIIWSEQIPNGHRPCSLRVGPVGAEVLDRLEENDP